MGRGGEEVKGERWENRGGLCRGVCIYDTDRQGGNGGRVKGSRAASHSSLRTCAARADLLHTMKQPGSQVSVFSASYILRLVYIMSIIGRTDRKCTWMQWFTIGGYSGWGMKSCLLVAATGEDPGHFAESGLSVRQSRRTPPSPSRMKIPPIVLSSPLPSRYLFVTPTVLF